jgi:cysteinyl-tRNA synthetase
MAARYLGQPIDIHGGGSDLVFPHHENEIAQSEGAADQPFASLWVHNGMITFGAEKMSKSVGNVRGIREVTSEVPGDALRLLFLQTHYRAPLDFSAGRLDEGRRTLERLCETLARADEGARPIPPPDIDSLLAHPDSDFERRFCDAMDTDLNAAQALGFVFERATDLNRALDAGDRAAQTIRAEIGRVTTALGLVTRSPPALLEEMQRTARRRVTLSSEEIEAAIEARMQARQRKDWGEADAIRDRLAAQGIVLKDGPDGKSWQAE